MISEHIEQHLGKIHAIISEVEPDTIPIDIYIIKATEAQPFHILVTSGMSHLPMQVAEGINDGRYLELMMMLPATWPIPEQDKAVDGSQQFNEETYWPIELLTNLAKFPHENETWFGFAHTIPNGDDAPEPYASTTQLCSAILLPSLFVPDEFQPLAVSPEKKIEFLSVIPLYQEELDLTTEQGTEALLKLFIEHNISDLVIPDRINVGRLSPQ